MMAESHCRVCGLPGRLNAHHLVPRSLGGDDVGVNIVALCGSGTTGCHGKFEDGNKATATAIRRSLTPDELAYIVCSKSFAFLDHYYPLPQQAVTAVPGATTPVERGEPQPPAPGETCPTCERRVPHPRKPSSPTSKTVSFRMPVDAHESYRELVDAAAEHLGIAAEPFHHFATVNAGLVLVLQGPADALRKESQ